MLVHHSRYLHTPIMSLQTGAELAKTTRPLINPENLHIIAYEVEGKSLRTNPSLLRTVDIRENSRLGFIIDDSDELVEPGDIISLDALRKLQFDLIGMHVIDEDGRKLGIVEDYIIDNEAFVVMQLQIRFPIMQRINNTSNLIARTQIVEINDKHIVVASGKEKISPVERIADRAFINPFSKQQPEQAD